MAKKTPTMTETQFLKSVVSVAEDGGWLVYHTYDSRRSQAGFPDLVMTRAGRTIFAELKSQKGRIKAAQQNWLDELRKTKGLEVFLWRPSDMDEVVKNLMGHRIVAH